MCLCSSVYKNECFASAREKIPEVSKKVTAIILPMLRALKVLHITQTERSLALTEEGDVWGDGRCSESTRGLYTQSLGR